MEQSEQENEARMENMKALLKLIFNEPDMELPDAPPLPPEANEVEKALEARIVRLEEQMQFLVKVTWRTSAAVIGTVFAGPAREVLLSVVRTWLGQ